MQLERKPHQKPQVVDYELLQKLMRQGYNPSIIPQPQKPITKKKKEKKKDKWKPQKKRSQKDQIQKEEKSPTAVGILFSKPKEIVPTQFPLKPPD